MNDMNHPGLIGVAGIALIAIDGLIHFSLVPEYFEYASYLGLLFLANTFGSVLSALGINMGSRWGWTLGALTAGGAFAMYVVSRLFGLPGLPESEREWLDPQGVLSLIVEGLFVTLYLLWRITRTAPERGNPAR
jgi:hypothetical protein